MWWPLLLLLLSRRLLLLLLSPLLAISIVPHHFRLPELTCGNCVPHFNLLLHTIHGMCFFSLTACHRISFSVHISIADSFCCQHIFIPLFSTHFFRFRLVHAHFSFWYDNALSGNYSTFIDCAFSFVRMPIKRSRERELYGQVSVYSNINNIGNDGNSQLVVLLYPNSQIELINWITKWNELILTHKWR